jgi:outer membrane receptor protein involved in Fe transport
VPITSGGNRSLANEEGRSYTFGVVLQPSFVPRFRAAVDWNRIRIAGNIASLTPQNIAEGCYDNPNFNTADVDNANPFCSLIRRDRSTDPARNGQLSNNAARPGLVTNFVNGAFIEFRGLTAEIDYNFPIGNLKVDLGGSLFYLENLKQSNNGVTITDNQKTLGNPEFSGQLNVGLTSGPLGVDLQANYQSSQWIGLRTDTVETRDVLTVPEVWTFNLGTSLKVQENSIMRFNVSNLFDRLPPYPIVGNGLGVYDWIGRRFSVSFEHKF